jgi:hypothetical protein
LFGRLEHGGHVEVDVLDNKLTFDITPTEPGAPKRGSEKATAGSTAN